MSMPSPWMRPSPSPWRVGVRIEPFEACSGFTRVAAGRIAQPPTAAFVARLRPGRSPSQTAHQLPDPSTLIRVEPPSTRETRLQGAHGDSLLNPRMADPAADPIQRGPHGPHRPLRGPAFPIISRNSATDARGALPCRRLRGLPRSPGEPVPLAWRCMLGLLPDVERRASHPEREMAIE